jgi:hypothetical protein
MIVAYLNFPNLYIVLVITAVMSLAALIYQLRVSARVT